MLRFALCDDEPHALDSLSSQLRDCLSGRVGVEINSFQSGRALLDSGQRFDVVFLDVQMPPPDGLETAKVLRRRGDESLLVFLTVLRERVYDAFEVRAFDYLLKPVDMERLRRTLDRALAELNRGRLFIQRGNFQEVVPLRNIAYCEVFGRKIYIHHRDGAVLDYYDKLEALERRLGGVFFRCHRSYLVNLDCIRSLGGGEAVLSGGERIPVSRLRERELTQALLRRMREGRN